MFQEDICKHAYLIYDIKYTMIGGGMKKDFLRGYVSPGLLISGQYWTNSFIRSDLVNWMSFLSPYYSEKNLEIEEKQIGITPFIAC